jgi:hypothetical protein
MQVLPLAAPFPFVIARLAAASQALHVQFGRP